MSLDQTQKTTLIFPKANFLPLADLVEIRDSERVPVSKDLRTTGDIPYYGANGIQGYVENYLFDGTFLLVGEDGSVITKNGTPVLHWVQGKIWVNNHAHVLAEKPEVASLRYIYYALSMANITKLVRGTPPKLNQANLRSILIPVPSIAAQIKITQILDTFTALHAELNAELVARQQQYEYYRDQLLTFEEA